MAPHDPTERCPEARRAETIVAWLDEVRGTGIYRNDETQCWEAWVVIPEEGVKHLVSTCSVCAPEPAHDWWLQRVCGHVLKEWRQAIPAAA
ncbi:MAG: hypothetical protein ABIL09_07635 [Gemmatimonadota bacterium]